MVPRFFTPTNTGLLFSSEIEHSRVSHNASGQWLVLWNLRPPCHHDRKPFRGIRSDSCLTEGECISVFSSLPSRCCALFGSFSERARRQRRSKLVHARRKRPRVATPWTRHNRIRGILIVHLRSRSFGWKRVVRKKFKRRYNFSCTRLTGIMMLSLGTIKSEIHYFQFYDKFDTMFYFTRLYFCKIEVRRQINWSMTVYF